MTAKNKPDPKESSVKSLPEDSTECLFCHGEAKRQAYTNIFICTRNPEHRTVK